jgi:hypothetical protein
VRADALFVELTEVRAVQAAGHAWSTGQARAVAAAVRTVKGSGTMDTATARSLRGLLQAQPAIARSALDATLPVLDQTRRASVEDADEALGRRNLRDALSPSERSRLTGRDAAAVGVLALAFSRFAVECEARARAALADGLRREAPVHQVVSALENATLGRVGTAEVIARTEAAYAWSAVQNGVVDVLSGVVPGMRKRWTELVNDMTGAPLDNRVAPDSMVLHGQLAVDGLFIMPPDDRAPSKMVGKTWAQPPNRRNDRARLTVWRAGWGVPAWEWRGRRVAV